MKTTKSFSWDELMGADTELLATESWRHGTLEKRLYTVHNPPGAKGLDEHWMFYVHVHHSEGWQKDDCDAKECVKVKPVTVSVTKWVPE